MIITGRHSAEVSGALADVKSVLDDNSVSYEIYSKASDGLTISDIYALGNTIKANKLDYIIGIGGGSTLDIAKAAAVYASNDIDPMDIYNEHYEHSPLPVVCVPTTAGTGSDTTQYVMITLDDGTKRSYCAEECFPYSTFLDYRYTRTMPVEVSRNTAIDALCHAVESFINTKASSFSDIMALEAVRLIGKSADALVSGIFTDTDRENLLIAASTGGMALAYTGLNVVHAMGFQLTTRYNIPHGRANGSLLADFLFYAAKKTPMRAVQILDTFGCDLAAFKKFISSVIPTTETFDESEIKAWVDNSIVNTVIDSCPGGITAEDETEIYINSLIKKRTKYSNWY